MIVLISLIAALAVLLPDFYIWWTFVRGAAPLFWSIAYWVPSTLVFTLAGIFLGGVASGEWMMRLFFGLLLCVVIPKLIFTIISLIGLGAGLFAPKASVIGNICAVAVAGVCVAALLYGFFWGGKRIAVREVEFASADVPKAFDGYRILHVSDLHLGTYGSDTAFIGKLVERMNALEPDLILFTGDLVNTNAGEIAPFKETLSAMHAPDGVFSILGNHDYCTYSNHSAPDVANQNLEEVKQTETAMGWRLLLNEHTILHRGADSIALLGVENIGRPPFPSIGDLPTAMAGLPDNIFKILLSHDPTHWRAEVLPTTDIQLTLSGHTHAMQLKIGRFSPASWMFKEWGGIYREGDRVLNVSLGIGGTVPFRLGAWPEVTLLTLKN